MSRRKQRVVRFVVYSTRDGEPTASSFPWGKAGFEQAKEHAQFERELRATDVRIVAGVYRHDPRMPLVGEHLFDFDMGTGKEIDNG